MPLGRVTNAVDDDAREVVQHDRIFVVVEAETAGGIAEAESR